MVESYEEVLQNRFECMFNAWAAVDRGDTHFYVLHICLICWHKFGVGRTGGSLGISWRYSTANF